MRNLSFPEATIILATLTALVAVVFLWFLPTPDQRRTMNIVPIGFAEARGAGDWTPDVRKAFLADEANRWAVSPNDRQTHSRTGPIDWLPATGQCRYISRFVDVMERYGLDGDEQEMSRLLSQRQQCYTQFQ
jgi:hypothetical protein